MAAQTTQTIDEAVIFMPNPHYERLLSTWANDRERYVLTLNEQECRTLLDYSTARLAWITQTHERLVAEGEARIAELMKG